MLKLYELTEQYTALLAQAEDCQADEEIRAFNDTLEGLEGEIQEKIENCAAVIRTMDVNEAAITKEIDRLCARQRSLANAQGTLKAYMQHCMESAGLDRIKGARFTVSIQNNPPSVEIEDGTKLGPEYTRVEVRPLKALIGGALKLGVEVPGCRLVQTRSLRIR